MGDSLQRGHVIESEGGCQSARLIETAGWRAYATLKSASTAWYPSRWAGTGVRGWRLSSQQRGTKLAEIPP